jgi:hypothetical protein
MNGLVIEIAIYLGAAAAIGFFTGWFASRARVSTAASVPQRNESVDEHRPGRARPERAERNVDAVVERLSAEIDQIRGAFEELEDKHLRLRRHYDDAEARLANYEHELAEDGPPDRGSDGEPDFRPAPIATTVEDVNSEPGHPEPDEPLEIERTSVGRFPVSGKPDPEVDPLTGVSPQSSERSGSRDFRAEPLEIAEVEFSGRTVVESRGEQGAVHPLEELPGLTKSVVGRMEVLGLRTNMDLLNKCSTRSRMSTFSMVMGLELETLVRWVSTADFSRLDRMRKEDVCAVVDAGLESIQALSLADPADLHEKIADIRGARGTTSGEVISKWIEAAGDLQPLVHW